MIFLEHTGLSRITSILQSLDAPDRYFDAKIELLSYSKSDNMFEEENDEHFPKPSSNDSTYYFKAILNKCYQDYDFSNLNDSYFKEVKNVDDVVNTIYYDLSFIVGRMFPNFADELWTTIKQVVHVKNSEIYTFDSGGEDDPFNSESCISSFNYFLLDKRQQHILFLSCITRTRTDSPEKSEYPPSLQASVYSDTPSSKLEEDCLSDYEVPEIF